MSYPQLGGLVAIDLKSPARTAWGSTSNPFGVATTMKQSYTPVKTTTVVPVGTKTPSVIKTVSTPTKPWTDAPAVPSSPQYCGAGRWDRFLNRCVSLSPLATDSAPPTGGSGADTPGIVVRQPSSVSTWREGDPVEPAADGSVTDWKTSPLPLIAIGGVALLAFMFLPKGTARRR